ncbi:MAG TPA: alpha/beta hydrolase [Pirellulales bacterium]|jgi:endo-1,4-beta-xylanase|nr:alpha/beta hydrolase [Pirellulales bacterium]
MRSRRSLAAVLFWFLVSCAVAQAEEALQEIPLWPGGVPGFEDRKDMPDVKTDKGHGDYTITNVNNPSLTVFLPPKEKATGAAVVIAPGGGHRELWMVHEGLNEAKWLSDHGVACFVLKYRLAREKGSPYKLPDAPTQDGQRAMRLVRSRAEEWGIDPHRVGIMGCSAGGELAALVCDADGKGKDEADDPVERQSARPDFQALIYSGPLGIRNQTITKEMNLPPTFIAVGDEDGNHFQTMLANHYLSLKNAGVSAELHIYAKTEHGFGLRDSNAGKPSNDFIQQFYEFLKTEGFLKKA